jgi:hypothetical protein
MSEANEGIPQTSGSACGLCGSTSLTDLGHGNGNGTVICNTCGAHWWKRWYTRKEWEAWINEPNDPHQRPLPAETDATNTNQRDSG